VYISYIVRRTQIYLEERQLAKLKSAAKAEQRTVSDLIRDAIDEKLARPVDETSFEIALERASGMWAGRDDLGATDDYVRRLRRDRRGIVRR